MGDLWRSQEMQLVQLVIPAEAAHDTVEKVSENKQKKKLDEGPPVPSSLVEGRGSRVEGRDPVLPSDERTLF